MCLKLVANEKDLFWAFMDIEKALDRVDRDKLWHVLRLYLVSGNVLKAVQSFYVNCKSCVRVGNEVSERFSVNVGVRQRCVMLPWI